MNKWLKRTMIVLAAVAGFVILASVAATLYALVGYRKTWDVPLPATRASTDSSAIARGRYIVYGPGRCADCHSPDSTRREIDGATIGLGKLRNPRLQMQIQVDQGLM